ncbi:MAG: hypothetical protein BWY56_02608 [Acidobacteria bacterium ADurb.Bin340]|nr:MAG: hypothetical protein BWY56_02608 [Acidobacteria bacterium ADurb.Bin340]
MDAWGEDIHDLAGGQEGAHGVEPAAEGLADGHAIGADALVLEGEELAGAAQARLDFIQHQQAAVAVRQFPQALEEAVGRDQHPGFALDGFHEDGGGVGGEGRLHSLQVAVGHDAEARGEGPEAALAVGIRAEPHDGGGAAVEVALGHDDLGLGIGNALHVVGPLADGLEGRLHGLRAAVHEEGLVEAREPRELLQQGRELVVAEGTAGEGQALALGDHGLGDAGVIVALVHGGVGRQEIHVAPALHILQPHAFAAGGHHVQGMIIAGSVGVLLIDEGLAPGRGIGHGVLLGTSLG